MEEPDCAAENWGFTPPEAGPELDDERPELPGLPGLPDPPGAHVPMSGPELVISDGDTDDEDGTLLALCVSAVVIFASAIDRLFDIDGMSDCRPDNADCSLDTAPDAADADVPQPDGELTESPLI